MSRRHPSPSADPAYWRRRIAELDRRNCKTGKELQNTLKEIVEANTNLVRAEVINIIVEEFGQMVEATPMDTGRARSGWIMSDAPTEEKPPVVKRRGGGLAPEFRAAIEANLRRAEALKLTQPDIVYICNNVEYILALEAGWSVQAPTGFINSFLARMNQRLRALKV